MQIEFLAATPQEGGTVAVLVAANGILGQVAGDFDHRTGGAVRRALQLAGERADKRGTILELIAPGGLAFDRLLLLSVGKAQDLSPFDLESLGGSLAVKLGELGVERAVVALDALPEMPHPPAEAAIRLATGARLRAYRFVRYRTKPQENGARQLQSLTFALADAELARASYQPLAAVVDGVLHARDLVTEPANVLSPKAFAEACRQLGEEMGLDVQILEPAAMRELGMRALLAVAQGSAREPYTAVMRWTGGNPDDPPLALVGKGVCFDSGGLSLKPASGMEEMKWDMGGAAAVFGAMKALAGRRARANVVGVIGLVENMPSGTAQRPGDVVTTMAGLTVEVVNTDAEGRLVLADLLHYTLDRFKPGIIVDLATLTGAIVVALGHEQAGLFAADEELARELTDAGAAVGEKLWRMPLGDEYAEHIKSEIADIKNVGRAREAGATAGAMFLKRFVPDVRWAHLDIAGVTWSKRDLALAPKGATGFGVRLLDRWIAARAER